MKEIHSHLTHSKGKLLQKKAIGIDSPWKYDSISETHFKSVAKTGDILLFRGSMMMTGVTRAVTNSEFDHVAIVLRLADD